MDIQRLDTRCHAEGLTCICRLQDVVMGDARLPESPVRDWSEQFPGLTLGGGPAGSRQVCMTPHLLPHPPPPSPPSDPTLVQLNHRGADGMRAEQVPPTCITSPCLERLFQLRSCSQFCLSGSQGTSRILPIMKPPPPPFLQDPVIVGLRNFAGSAGYRQALTKHESRAWQVLRAKCCGKHLCTLRQSAIIT